MSRIKYSLQTMTPTRWGTCSVLTTDFYIFYARCRTSYSRWIISCSHW